MLERFCGLFALVVVICGLLPASLPAGAQADDDLDALQAQLEQLIRARKYDDAAEVARRALSAAEHRYGAEHAVVAQLQTSVALLHQHQGRYDQAEPSFRRALEVRQTLFGPDSAEVASSEEMLATLYRIKRRHDEAERLLSDALRVRERLAGADPAKLCPLLSKLAVVYQTQGRASDAEMQLRRCLSMREKTLSPNHPDIGQSLHELARFYRAQGRTADADPLFAKALAVLGPNHPEAVLASIRAGDYEKAARALDLVPRNRGAAEDAVRRTFFGQVTDLRWTSYRSDLSAANRVLTIEGEAVHGNQLWQPFSVQMTRDGDEWKMRSVTLGGLAWR